MRKECPFCELTSSSIIDESNSALAIRDAYPVTKYHSLIIPKRHVADYFELSLSERDEIQKLLENQRQQILELDQSVSGFNIGVNVGEDAGQTVFHCHLHLIPRRKGDGGPDPQGGVRGVIPGKQRYKSKP